MSDKHGYKADNTSRCKNCDESPTVIYFEEGKPDYHFDMCGVCTFGESACHDTDEWVTKEQPCTIKR